MSIINIINNEQITLIQGVGGLFLCEESWVTQNKKKALDKNIIDKDFFCSKNENFNTEQQEAELLEISKTSDV